MAPLSAPTALKVAVTSPAVPQFRSELMPKVVIFPDRTVPVRINCGVEVPAREMPPPSLLLVLFVMVQLRISGVGPLTLVMQMPPPLRDVCTLPEMVLLEILNPAAAITP